jgi:hypothetical protein
MDTHATIVELLQAVLSMREGVNMEAEKSPLFRTVTKQRPLKTK